MRTPLRLATVLAVVLITASSCGLSSEGPGAGQGPATPAPTTPATSGTTPSGTASPSASPGVGAALPDDLRTRPAVAEAIADAASRAAVAPEQVVVAAWSAVTWTDGSLGCPKADMAYTQALVEGELLILRGAGRLFQYHARTGGSFGYCAAPSAGYSVGG